jgi:signal transduction histidine kinase
MKSLWKQLHTSRGGALAALLLSLLILLPAWFWAGNWYRRDLIQQTRAKVTVEMAARANALTSAINQRIALLQGLYAFTRTEWPTTQFDQPFEIYSSGLYFNSTGVQTLMIAPEGITRYVFPIADSPALSGYDVLHDPDPATRADVQRAIHSREITLSQPGKLRQGGFGVTAWKAVYRGTDLWGLVSIAVDMNVVLADSGLTNPAGGVGVALRDGAGQTFFGANDVWKGDPVIQSILLPEGAWQLGGIPQGGWDGAVRSQLDIFRLSSLLIIGLVAAMIYLTVNRQGQLTQAVALRTRQIAAAQQELEQRVQERTSELSTLLNVSRRIGSTLDLDTLLKQILSEMKNVLDYTAASICRLDDDEKMVQVSEAGAVPFTENPQPLVDEALIHQVVDSLQPVILQDWAAEGVKPEKMCWMGVPLVIKDRAIGLFAFIHSDPHYYHQEQANLALAFAQQVAVAIENARLYEQAGQLAVLEERQRLARELHDSVSQVLYSIGLGTKTARAALDHNPTQLAEALDYVNRLAEAGQVEMRALIFELRPETLRTDGLVAALEKEVAVLQKRHQLDVQVHLCPEPPVSLTIKETLYRVSQEAIHNIVKHAHATQASLSLEYSENRVCLEISDNGIGFDPMAEYPGHLGLKSMRERAAQCNGQVQIDSAPDNGTKVRLIIPINNQ